MNARYFLCRAHRRFTDAGYRWAYWELERRGVVSLGQQVDVAAVLDARSYWKHPEDERGSWLCSSILPTVKQFLEAHRTDGVEYADEEFLTEQWVLGNEWLEVVAPDQGEQAEDGDTSQRPC